MASEYSPTSGPSTQGLPRSNETELVMISPPDGRRGTGRNVTTLPAARGQCPGLGVEFCFESPQRHELLPRQGQLARGIEGAACVEVRRSKWT